MLRSPAGSSDKETSQRLTVHLMNLIEESEANGSSQGNLHLYMMVKV